MFLLLNLSMNELQLDKSSKEQTIQSVLIEAIVPGMPQVRNYPLFLIPMKQKSTLWFFEIKFCSVEISEFAVAVYL